MPKLIEILEFFDNSGNTMIKRLPEDDKTEIKWGAQLTVRESQKAIFFKDGKAVEIFDPGRYVLDTKNIPVLTKFITSFVYGPDSPFRAEVYFVSVKLFRNFKWGTQRRINLKDKEFELIRLGANGIYSVQINDPKLFLTHIVGTQGRFKDSEISDYLQSIIVAKLTKVLGDFFDTILNLPQKINDLEDEIKKNLVYEFTKLGLLLYDFHIASFTIPSEVEKSIDTKAGMKAIGDLNDFLQYKIAQSIEKASENNATTSEGLGVGVGLGMGMALPKIIQDNFEKSRSGKEDSFEKIRKLKELLDINAITQEEFEKKKNQLLNNL